MNVIARNFAKEWSQHWFGFWAEEAELTSRPFSLSDHVDPSWQPEDLHLLVKYLESAPVVMAAQSEQSTCAFCDHKDWSSAYRSDGIWLWPDPLAHLVANHSFILPDKLVCHIRSVGHVPPVTVEKPWQEFPWPRSE